ncbi:hypothetical protein Bca4012_024492 [Brassica carinata]
MFREYQDVWYRRTGEKSIVFKPIYFVFVSSGDSFEKKRNIVLLVHWKIRSKSKEKVLKDSMKPSQFSSAYVSESWS